MRTTLGLYMWFPLGGCEVGFSCVELRYEWEETEIQFIDHLLEKSNSKIKVINRMGITEPKLEERKTNKGGYIIK